MGPELFDAKKVIVGLNQGQKDIIMETLRYQERNDGRAIPLGCLSRGPLLLEKLVARETVALLCSVGLTQYQSQAKGWEGVSSFITDEGSLSLTTEGQAAALTMARMREKQNVSRIRSATPLWNQLRYRVLPSPKAMSTILITALVTALVTLWLIK